MDLRSFQNRELSVLVHPVPVSPTGPGNNEDALRFDQAHQDALRALQPHTELVRFMPLQFQSHCHLIESGIIQTLSKPRGYGLMQILWCQLHANLQRVVQSLCRTFLFLQQIRLDSREARCSISQNVVNPKGKAETHCIQRERERQASKTSTMTLSCIQLSTRRYGRDAAAYWLA